MRMNTRSLALMAAMMFCVYFALPSAGVSVEYGSIAGHVIDSKTQKPIGYANIVIVGTTMGAMTLPDGCFTIRQVPAGRYTVRAMMMGYKTMEEPDVMVHANKTTELTFALTETVVMKTEKLIVAGERPMVDVSASAAVRYGDELHMRGGRSRTTPPCRRVLPGVCRPVSSNGESYDRLDENGFMTVMDNPLSTFSIDVDAASYANVRRFVQDGVMPPPDAVRIEEFINYFNYRYPDPDDSLPFSITGEVAACPWNEGNKLVHIGIQGRRLALEDLPPNNLVFLLDVSGSMQPPNKLPLLKSAFRLLVNNLRAEDRVALVVYAGSAWLVLPSTRGDQKCEILEAVERLRAGGSTAGAAGIQLAYDIAAENYLKNGNNRVILATDGDFNVGPSGDEELARFIEEKRENGIFLSVLGFGTGNLKDSKMEKLADKGNGHYAYIDDILEARKVLVEELGATLFTIAKDVKIQVAFNPVKVKSYRLIGYENRRLEKEDFDDDSKDAGELGAGHSVTALYEIVPVRGDEDIPEGTKLKYLNIDVSPEAKAAREILTVRLRYKEPDAGESRLLTRTVIDHEYAMKNVSVDFRFAAAVAEFGLILRDSKFKGNASFRSVIRNARETLDGDAEGYRSEFVRLAEVCRDLTAKE